MKTSRRSQSATISRLMMLVQKSLLKRMADETKADGIDIPIEEIRILHVIKEFNEPVQQDLADHLMLDKSLLFRRIRSLETKGYVTRVKDDEDKRKNRTILTTRGITLVEKTALMRENVIKDFLEGVPMDQVKQFTLVLNDMYENATKPH